MGAAIQMTWSQALVRPNTPSPGNRWHPDGPKPYYFPRINGEMPQMQLKVGFFLTEIDRPDMGNLCVVPGSHKNGFPKIPEGLEYALKITSFTEFRQVEQIDAGVPGARQLMVEPGDAIGMHNGLFHCVVRNTSNVRRKNLYYAYGPMWQRAGDRVGYPPNCWPSAHRFAGNSWVIWRGLTPMAATTPTTRAPHWSNFSRAMVSWKRWARSIEITFARPSNSG